MVVEPEPVPEQSPRPSLVAMAASFASSAIGHAANGFRKASPEVQEARRAICLACPKSINEAKGCSACGCGVIGALSFVGLDMDEKRAWASSRCPLAVLRWGKV